jgi:drug/metabolite transporter (DMT)-like permease
MLGETFRISRKDWGTVFILSLLRAATSFSLVIAYQNIASGVASTIHFMYPLAVALAMMGFFGEKRSFAILFAVLVSLSGAGLLSSGKIDFEGGNTTIGLIAAGLSVFFYGGYIVGVRKSRAVQIPSTALTCYVMGLGALFFIIGGYLTGGIRLANDTHTWLNILGLALPATAISNITLVKAIKYIGPTLTSIFGALEPLTAVVIGCLIFNESFTPASAIGMALIITAVTVVVVHEKKKESQS